MIEVTIAPSSEHIIQRGSKWSTYAVSLDLQKWLEDKGIPSRYKQLWGTHRSGDLRHPQAFHGFRFEFDDERMAVMFKLTWGGA